MTTPPQHSGASSARNPKVKKAASTTEAQANRRTELQAQRLAQAKKARTRRMAVIAAAILAAVVALSLMAWAFTSMTRGVAVSGKPTGAKDDAAVAFYPGTAKAGAPVIEVYSDFQCPSCKFYEEGVGGELDRLAKAGEIELRTRSLTFLEEHPSIRNDWSTRGAEAVACAGTPGIDKYEAAFSQLYQFQPEREGQGFSDKILREDLPAAVGISGGNLATYQKCYDDEAMLGFVRSVDKSGRADIEKIEKRWGTPTYARDGKKLDFSPLYDKTKQTWDTAGLLELIKKG